MKFFRIEDFLDPKSTMHSNVVYIDHAVDYANTKLERDAILVYGTKYDNDKKWAFDQQGILDETTHKALIINIEPIEKCDHIDAFCYTRHTNDGPEYLIAWCKHCSMKFKLTEIK